MLQVPYGWLRFDAFAGSLMPAERRAG